MAAILDDVFERFTERARQLVVLAQEESRGLRHNYIGTEHILLGLLREEEGQAAHMLEAFEVTADRARAQIVRVVGPGEEITAGQIPFTPRAKKVLELALHEALALGHNYIGTEHILLGLLRENDGVAAEVLVALDVDTDQLRDAMLSTVSGREPAPPAQATRPQRPHRTPQTIDPQWLDGLGALLNQLAREIRHELGREPDAGDLLLALACAQQTLVAQSLQQLGVDLDALWATIERQRQQVLAAQEELARKIEQVRAAKNRAIEAQQFDNAAQLRDQERGLTEQRRHEQRRALQARQDAGVTPEILQDIRRRLGLPTQPDPPTTTIG